MARYLLLIYSLGLVATCSPHWSAVRGFLGVSLASRGWQHVDSMAWSPLYALEGQQSHTDDVLEEEALFTALRCPLL